MDATFRGSWGWGWGLTALCLTPWCGGGGGGGGGGVGKRANVQADVLCTAKLTFTSRIHALFHGHSQPRLQCSTHPPPHAKPMGAGTATVRAGSQNTMRAMRRSETTTVRDSC